MMSSMVGKLGWYGVPVAVLALWVGALGWGQQFTVCPSGCPFQKIQEAIERARPGDTITVGPGTYVENLLIDKPLTLQGAARDQVVINGSPGCRGGREGVRITAPDVQVERLTVTGCAIGVGVRSAARLVNVALHGNAIGLEAWDGSEVTLEQGSITDSTVGVEVWALGRARLLRVEVRQSGIGAKVLRGAIAEIQQSTFTVNGLGVEVWDAERVTLENVALTANQGDGLWVHGPAGAVVAVRGSTIADNEGNGVRLEDEPYRPDAFQAELANNIIERNGACGVGAELGEEIKVSGQANTIRDNGAGDLCPADFPWPSGFRK